MTDTSDSDPPVLVLAPTMLVILREDGAQIQRPVMAPPVFLGLPGLHLLALLEARPSPDPVPALVEAAERGGCEREDLRDLHLGLRMTKDLAEGVPWEHPEAPDHPESATSPPLDLSSDELLVLRLPLTLRLRRGRYEILDGDGLRWLALDPDEAHLVAQLVRPMAAREAIAAAGPVGRVDDDRAAAILGRLDAAGLLRHGPAELPEDPLIDPGSDEALALDRDAVVATRFRQHFASQNEAEEQRRATTGEVRPRVVPVTFDLGVPAGLSCLIAYAKEWDGGRLDAAYELRTDWWWDEENIGFFTAAPAIYLFSNYLWSHERCLDVSRRIKELSPGSITVHGGPDTPKYESDVEAYFAANPHVDITVRGEGEVTAAELLAALRPVLGAVPPDLSVLADVAGLSYRGADGHAVRTADRDRIADLDTIPSPLLTGLVDVYRDIPETLLTLETNRGCPYGCTFCDWGSATTSRVRKYDMDRVVAELEWCSDNHITSVSVADANFGMFARDVEIAEALARFRARNSYPKSFGVSYAKNTVKHLQSIIGVLADAGVVSQGVLSLQSMDADTLQVIHRSNIKTERYDALADRMREAQLPLMVELMMGLPGMTLDSFADDLQQCIEREVPARINRTTLLVNSPMNNPEYIEEHQIRTHEPLVPGRNSLVVSTATFTEDDWREMERLRIEFGYFENFGVLRLVSRYLRHRTGVREIELYRDLAPRVLADSTRWPALAATVTHGSAVMAPIYSWAVLMEEVRDYLGERYGLGGSGLDAVLLAQRAILPSSGRTFPTTVELPHDVVAWYRAVLAAKGVHDGTHWTEVVTPLDDLPPGTVTVDDPEAMTDLYIGLNREAMAVGISWELDSPLSRPTISASQLPDWAVAQIFPQREPERPAGGAVKVGISARPS